MLTKWLPEPATNARAVRMPHKFPRIEPEPWPYSADHAFVQHVHTTRAEERVEVCSRQTHSKVEVHAPDFEELHIPHPKPELNRRATRKKISWPLGVQNVIRSTTTKKRQTIWHPDGFGLRSHRHSYLFVSTGGVPQLINYRNYPVA